MCGNERLNQLKVPVGDVVFCEIQQIGQSSGPRLFDDRVVIRIEDEKYMIGPGTVDWDGWDDEHGWCYRKQIYGRLITAIVHYEVNEW